MYTRTKINPGSFADWLPEGAELYMSPKLPTIEFKKNGIEYEVTDLRLLHPAAIEVLNIIINMMCNNAALTEAKFGVNTDEDTVDVIIDILMGISVRASKKGRDGFVYEGTAFCYGVRREYSSDEKNIVFELNKDVAPIVYNYVQGKALPISYYDMMAAIADHQHKEICKAMNKKKKWRVTDGGGDRNG